MPTVEIERAGAVARVWLNRPEQHNALSADLVSELTLTAHALAHDDTVRIVVLGGRGPSFCAGADISAMRASATASFEANLAAAELDTAIEERVSQLLAGGPHAQSRIKTLLELWADTTWEEYRAALPRMLAEVRSSEEAKDGLSAFLEKRKPRWMA